MKWNIAFILLLIYTNLFSQEYQRMVEDGVTWINTKEGYSEPKEFYVYQINGDTIINENEYKILNLQDFEIDSDGVMHLLLTGIPSALMREDTLVKKVYTIILNEEILLLEDLEAFEESFGPGEYENEYLLYDFGLEVGDTIHGSLGYSVFSIKFIDWFGFSLKNFFLEISGEYYEKIGNPFSLFVPLQSGFTQGGAPSVVHYCIHDSIPCTYLAIPTSNNEVLTSEFSIFPNPAKEYVTFKLADNLIESLWLYSSDGQLLKTINGTSLNEIEVDLSTIEYIGVIHVVYEAKNSRFLTTFLKM